IRWRRVWAKTCATAGITGVETYTLKHTAASMAIAAGADPKTVQRMLGHSSAAMTLDIYGLL
ncbi:MAG TPA: tyrosine-type recombinase/integrase, partial [Corynebacterium sp.]|nr:tyrosine-type recombinase/integrase [Corynebacterium sp.]